MRFGSTGCQLSTLPFYFYIFSENAQVGCDQRPPPFGGRRTHGTDRGLSIYVVGLSACSHCNANQICTGLPKITEDAVTQLSRDKHEDLADSYSIAVEDIPPMNRKHATAVGLHVALPLLRSNGKKGSGNEDLCQMMRSHIASHLTDYERTQYLQ